MQIGVRKGEPRACAQPHTSAGRARDYSSRRPPRPEVARGGARDSDRDRLGPRRGDRAWDGPGPGCHGPGAARTAVAGQPDPAEGAWGAAGLGRGGERDGGPRVPASGGELPRSRCRNGGPARDSASCRAAPYRTVSYHTVPCRAVPPAGQSLARCRGRSRSPLSFQAVDDLLRCGICFDYFSIAVIIPQCSHNCKCGSARPLGSRPSRPAAPCPAQLCPCCVRGPGALRAALQAAACRQLWQKARGSTTRAEAGCHSGRSAAGSEDTFPSAPRSSQQRCSAASPRAIQGAPAKTRRPRGLTKPSAPFCG